MKILYAIQGTGNGHLSRARDIIPMLQTKGEVDLLISGIQADVSLPYPVKYQFKGLSFIFGKSGGVDLFQTFKKCNFKRLVHEIASLPVSDYDLIINDFEPVSAWACFFKNKQCISLSHQSAVLNPKAAKPKEKDFIGRSILKFYAPVSDRYGFHFLPFDANIFTPVIRKEIRTLPVTKGAHYSVYLPAYSDEKIVKLLNRFPDVNWQVFSKRAIVPALVDNITIFPIDNEGFIKSLATSTGVLCGAGFETPAEALFLKKKLLVIPMKNQYEQQCNAAVLKSMGVPVINKLAKKNLPKIKTWLQSDQNIAVDYPDQTEQIINGLIENYAMGQIDIPQVISGRNRWKQIVFDRILSLQ